MRACLPMVATTVSATNSAQGTAAFVTSAVMVKSPITSRQVASSAQQALQARTGAAPSVRPVERLTSCKWSASRATRSTAQPTMALTAHARSVLTVLNRMSSKLAARHVPLVTLVPVDRVIDVIWALSRTATAPNVFSAQTIVSASTGTSANFALLASSHVMTTERA